MNIDSITAALAFGGGSGGGNEPLIIYSSSSTSSHGYRIPELTTEQIIQAYNAVVAGKTVILTDERGIMHFNVNQADIVGSEIAITVLFFDEFIITYFESGEISVHNMKNFVVRQKYITNLDDSDEIELDTPIIDIINRLKRGDLVFGNIKVAHYTEDQEDEYYEYINGMFTYVDDSESGERLYFKGGNHTFYWYLAEEE